MRREIDQQGARAAGRVGPPTCHNLVTNAGSEVREGAARHIWAVPLYVVDRPDGQQATGTCHALAQAKRWFSVQNCLQSCSWCGLGLSEPQARKGRSVNG